jgi:hypothetical protein
MDVYSPKCECRYPVNTRQIEEYCVVILGPCLIHRMGEFLTRLECETAASCNCGFGCCCCNTVLSALELFDANKTLGPTEWCLRSFIADIFGLPSKGDCFPVAVLGLKRKGRVHQGAASTVNRAGGATGKHKLTRNCIFANSVQCPDLSKLAAALLGQLEAEAEVAESRSQGAIRMHNGCIGSGKHVSRWGRQCKVNSWSSGSRSGASYISGQSVAHTIIDMVLRKTSSESIISNRPTICQQDLEKGVYIAQSRMADGGLGVFCRGVLEAGWL